MKKSEKTASIRPGTSRDPEAINVLFLCDEWKSSKGGLSTFNRELAVNLARSSLMSTATSHRATNRIGKMPNNMT